MSKQMSFPYQFWLILIALALLTTVTEQSAGQSVQRGEWEDILKLVSADVQKNFYDPGMKGLDWSGLTDETRQRIRASGNIGQMILAVSSLVDRLQDSHTYFIPPGQPHTQILVLKPKLTVTMSEFMKSRRRGQPLKLGCRLGMRFFP
jgi:hypothetical protein